MRAIEMSENSAGISAVVKLVPSGLWQQKAMQATEMPRIACKCLRGRQAPVILPVVRECYAYH